ncbi:CpaD family pilus assembly lipoprotein [Sphingomonas sp. CJ20]
MVSRFAPLLLVPLVALGACGTYNGGLDPIHQPVVQRGDYSFDVAVSGDRLAPGEGQRLAGWMASMGLKYGDRVAIDDGADGSTGRAEVAALAGSYGLLLADRAPMTPGQIAPGTARVVVTRMTASVPGCPDFTRQYQPDYAASTSSNLGCATNTNLARMVADPADLVRGASGAPTADPATAGKAVNALRNAAPSGAGGTAVKSESPGGGK